MARAQGRKQPGDSPCVYVCPRCAQSGRTTRWPYKNPVTGGVTCTVCAYYEGIRVEMNREYVDE